MKELLMMVMVVALVWLWLDDRSQRSALEQAQGQMQEVTTQRDQLRSTGPGSSAPEWFQQRLQEPSALTSGSPSGRSRRGY